MMATAVIDASSLCDTANGFCHRPNRPVLNRFRDRQAPEVAGLDHGFVSFDPMAQRRWRRFVRALIAHTLPRL
jgi:hypothetical protein